MWRSESTVTVWAVFPPLEASQPMSCTSDLHATLRVDLALIALKQMLTLSGCAHLHRLLSYGSYSRYERCHESL